MELIEIKWMVGKSGGKRCWAYSYCEVCKDWVLASRINRHRTKNPKHLRLIRPAVLYASLYEK